MVDLAGFARFEDDAHAGALLRADQVMMHGAAGQQRADGDAVRTDLAVREDDEAVAFEDGVGDFTADAVQGVKEA